MPLSAPADREPIHTRTVVCNGFRRTDGLWDIEGRITDVKAYAFQNEARGTVHPGDPVHDMWIRLTVDDQLEVKAVEAVTDSSPYPSVCPVIAPNFQRLVGLRIGPGWTRAVKERLGGVEGCTHLVELLGPVATTAFQTIFPIVAMAREARGEGEDPGRRPRLLNSCHTFRSDGEVVRKAWPGFYTGDGPAAG